MSRCSTTDNPPPARGHRCTGAPCRSAFAYCAGLRQPPTTPRCAAPASTAAVVSPRAVPASSQLSPVVPPRAVPASATTGRACRAVPASGQPSSTPHASQPAASPVADAAVTHGSPCPHTAAAALLLHRRLLPRLLSGCRRRRRAKPPHPHVRRPRPQLASRSPLLIAAANRQPHQIRPTVQIRAGVVSTVDWTPSLPPHIARRCRHHSTPPSSRQIRLEWRGSGQLPPLPLGQLPRPSERTLGEALPPLSKRPRGFAGARSGGGEAEKEVYETRNILTSS